MVTLAWDPHIPKEWATPLSVPPGQAHGTCKGPEAEACLAQFQPRQRPGRTKSSLIDFSVLFKNQAGSQMVETNGGWSSGQIQHTSQILKCLCSCLGVFCSRRHWNGSLPLSFRSLIKYHLIEKPSQTRLWKCQISSVRNGNYFLHQIWLLHVRAMTRSLRYGIKNDPIWDDKH